MTRTPVTENLIATRPINVSRADAAKEAYHAKILSQRRYDTNVEPIFDLDDSEPISLTLDDWKTLPPETLQAILDNKLAGRDRYNKIQKLIPFIDLLDLANQIKAGKINIEDIDEAIDQLG